MSSKPDLTIICDTREQKPWKFIHPTIRKGLDAGDYSLLGAERKLRIERKGRPAELARNCSKDWRRFRDALRALAKYKHKCIICDFSMADIMYQSWPGSVTPEVLIGRISEITLEIGIPIIFAGRRSRQVAEMFFVRYYNRM